MIIYQWEFKDNIKDKFIHHEVTIKTLKELIKAAIKIDDKLYEKAMKKRYNNLCNRTDIYTEI